MEDAKAPAIDPVLTNPEARSVRIAQRGLKSWADTMELSFALATDVLLGTVKPNVANSARSSLLAGLQIATRLERSAKSSKSRLIENGSGEEDDDAAAATASVGRRN